MKVSVLTPTWNRRDFLPRAVRSVLAQTHKDWEMIVYDVSDTPVRDVMPDDNRVVYLRGERAGPAADFQRCLDHATGDLVHPLGDDDQLAADALETAAREIGDHDWLVGVTELRNESGHVFAHRGGTPEALAATVAGEYMLGGAVYWRKPLSDTLGGFDTRYDGAADFDLYVRFARASTPKLVSQVMYLYTDHAGTDSRVNAQRQQEASGRIRSVL